jgi:hypothetical protein
MKVHKNSFGDFVVYREGKYVSMAMREVDGVWVAISAAAPKVAMPCFSREHALTMAVLMVGYEEVEYAQ